VVPAIERPVVTMAVATFAARPNGQYHFTAVSASASFSGVVDAGTAEEAVIEVIHLVRRAATGLERIRFVVSLPHHSPLWRIADETPMLLPGVSVERARLQDLPLLEQARKHVAAAMVADSGLSQSDPTGAVGELVDTTPITAATDGSVRGTYSGWGWLASTGDFGLLGFGHDTRQIGTRVVLIAELRAIGDAVRRLRGRKLTILTDSRQAIGMVEDWMNGLDRLPTGYTTERAKGDAGLVRVRRLIAAERDNLTVQWVRAHTGEPLNEGADALARLASRYARGDSGLSAADYRARAAGLAGAFAEHFNRLDDGAADGSPEPG
jgi:ribonuclease HI